MILPFFLCGKCPYDVHLDAQNGQCEPEAIRPRLIGQDRNEGYDQGAAGQDQGRQL